MQPDGSPAMPAPMLQPYDWDCKILMISACSFPFCSISFLQVRTSSWTSPHSSWMPYFSRSPSWRGVSVQLLKVYGFWSFETIPKNQCLMICQAKTLVDTSHMVVPTPKLVTVATTGSLDVAILAFSAGRSNLTCRCSIVYQILSGQLRVLEIISRRFSLHIENQAENLQILRELQLL